MIVPPPNNYCFSFDTAAAEIRDVCGQSGELFMTEILCDPERDSHIETSALAYNIKPYQVTKDLRGQVKAVIFGAIYGISEYGLCVTSYKMQPTNENLQFCKDMIVTIRNTLPNVFTYVDACGKFAVKNSYIINPDRRVRYFNNKKQSTGSIERAGLNFPIQSHSAGIFREAYLAFKKALRLDGLLDLVRVYLLVHDEIKGYAHESVHPYHIAHIVYNNCIIRLDGYAPFYVGLGFGMNAYEAKSDVNELPVRFLEIKAREWEEGKWLNHELKAHEVPGFVKGELDAYMYTRYCDELLAHGFNPDKVDLSTITELCESYYILRKVEHFSYLKVDKDVLAAKIKVDPSLKKKDADEVRYRSVFLLYIMFKKMNYAQVTLVDGTTVTFSEFLKEYILSEGKEVITTVETLSAPVREIPLGEIELSMAFDEAPMNDDLDVFGTLDDALQLEDISDEHEFGALDIAAAIDLLEDEVVTLYNGESAEANAYGEGYVDEADFYPVELEVVDPTATRMADRYRSKDIQMGYSLEAKKYKVMGKVLYITLNTSNYEKAIDAINGMRTISGAEGYSVIFEVEGGSLQNYLHMIKPDWDILEEVL